MTRERKLLIWIIAFIAFGLMVQALSSILLPFVAGILIAYFLDPVADRLKLGDYLQRLFCSRSLL